MTGLWNDFNDAQSNTNLIPKGTLAKVRLTIRPGGFDDASQGWTGGYATRGSTGAVYLNGEFTVTEGPYARRKIFTLIGLYSPKGPDWANMGRSLVRGMLNSARGISDKDMSAEAQAARRIGGFADLDGIEFIARIDIGTDASGDDKNEIRSAVTPDHRDYAQAMGGGAVPRPAAIPRPMSRARAAAAAAPCRAVRHGRSKGRQPCAFVRARASSWSAASLRSAITATRSASLRPASGKTITLSAVVARSIAGSEAKACVLAHRDELTAQNRGKFGRVAPEIATSVVDAGSKDWAGQATFAMAPTLARAANLTAMPALDLLVIDEAHHAVADSYRRIIDRARERQSRCAASSASPPRRTGATARVCARSSTTSPTRSGWAS